MNRRTGAGAAWRRLNRSLWLWPSLAAAAAYGVGTALSAAPLGEESFAGVLFVADASGGRTLLTALVGGLVTALSVIFSLTITGLQTVHQQYSPRLLRNFVRDRGTKITLGVFAGTVAYMLAVLRAMPAADSAEPIPRLAIFGAMVLFMACVGVVAYFAQHITNSIRVHDAMQRVVRETRTAFRRALTSAEGGVNANAVADALPEPPHDAAVIPSPRTGYLQDVDLEAIADTAHRGGAVIRMRPAIGDQVVRGTPLAFVWSDRGAATRMGSDDLTREIAAHCTIGADRSEDTDLSYGFRQLVDVAVRAMSPSLNDPYTAMQAIDHLTVLLTDMARDGLPANVLYDGDGRPVAAMPSLGLMEYVRLATDQPRRYGAHEPAVAVRLLDLLRDVSTTADASLTPTLREEAQRVLDHAEAGADANADLRPVREAANAVLAASAAPQSASFVRM